jgi:lysophospholipase L1-like esterase
MYGAASSKPIDIKKCSELRQIICDKNFDEETKKNKILQLINEGADINVSINQWMPLSLAINQGLSLNFIQFLINDLQADPSAGFGNQSTDPSILILPQNRVPMFAAIIYDYNDALNLFCTTYPQIIPFIVWFALKAKKFEIVNLYEEKISDEVHKNDLKQLPEYKTYQEWLIIKAQCPNANVGLF